jgi:hypothetical protein
MAILLLSSKRLITAHRKAEERIARFLHSSDEGALYRNPFLWQVAFSRARALLCKRIKD